MKTTIQKHSILITLIPVLLVMAVIFGLSAQTGADTGQTSGGITQLVVGLVVPGFDDLSPMRQAAILGDVDHAVRKLAHFGEYFLLGVTLLPHVLAVGKKVVFKRPWLVAWVAGTAYAVTDELHQGLVGGRNPKISDVFLDGFGVTMGILAVLLAIRYIKRRKK